MPDRTCNNINYVSVFCILVSMVDAIKNVVVPSRTDDLSDANLFVDSRMGLRGLSDEFITTTPV